MLDIKFIREHRELVAEAARKKRLKFEVRELLILDEKRLKLLAEVEQMRAEQNRVSEEIAGASETRRRSVLIASMRTLKGALQDREMKLAGVIKDWQKLMLEVPNLPDIAVPEGESDADNQELRRVGEPPSFDFAPRSHLDLMTTLGMVDFERGVKVAGFRGYILKDAGAILSFALWRFVLDQFAPLGFTPLIVPSLLKKAPFFGTSYLPQGEEDLYRTQDRDYLAGTAEVATMAYWQDEILSLAQLPQKFLAFSPCFRREAGSHGKDTKGLIRVHEFFKLEQVVICEASHETSVKWHEEITANAERLLQALGLPYRVVLNCGADLGLGQVKKYDLEVWLPSEKTYRETHSASYFHDFQTRRLNIRYRDEAGKLRFAHSLNNTAIATPRIIAALVENYQQADGTVAVPEVLQSYLGRKLIEPAA